MKRLKEYQKPSVYTITLRCSMPLCHGTLYLNTEEKKVDINLSDVNDYDDVLAD